MIPRFALRTGLALFATLFASQLAAKAPAGRAPSGTLVRLQTSQGPILIEVDLKRAPITAGNFLRYVDEKRLDDTSFYRAARAPSDPRRGLIQGGINHRLVRALQAIQHEPTSRTGLKHLDGTVSMARNDPGTAMGDFFITIGPAPRLDARPDYPGYAAFGRVVSGMPVVHRILALPTYPGGYSKATKGQSIIAPVKIITARRIP